LFFPLFPGEAVRLVPRVPSFADFLSISPARLLSFRFKILRLAHTEIRVDRLTRMRWEIGELLP